MLEEYAMLPEPLMALTRGVVALFIIMDPLGNIPIFVGLTTDLNLEERRRTFRVALIVSFALLVVFALTGDRLLSIFNISLDSFMIAGGMLLLLLAMKILVYGGWEEKKVEPDSVGAVPIACPLLVGPGAIVTVIILLQSSGILITFSAVIIVLIITWLILRYIGYIYRFLGKTGSLVIARVMAIFIAAIAVGYIVDGLSTI
ncbi:MAG: MarC family protein [Candidatus Bathyarchaeia archaeon]